MQYMLSWTIACGNHQAAGTAFLSSGAPPPEGLTIIGRWHGPGSVKGWALVETSDPKALYEHVGQWSQHLSLEATPVLEDAEAAAALSKVYGA